MAIKNIGNAPEALRIGAVEGSVGKVEREGGEYKAGLIREMSVITRGEALGHGLWIDKAMLDQVVEAGNAKGEGGVKARFAHPGLSSDGLGTLLGRVRRYRRKGGQVVADLHFVASAHETPEGDLAKYAMDMAEETPDLFGASIVFSLDEGAMLTFASEHEDKQGRFISPDKDNAANLPHARLRELLGADLVDEPAANPAGLFSALGKGNAVPAYAEELLSYALGMSAAAPAAPAGLEGWPHPERARTFIAGFLERRGLEIVGRVDGTDGGPSLRIGEFPETDEIEELKKSVCALKAQAADLERKHGDLERKHGELKAYVLGARR